MSETPIKTWKLSELDVAETCKRYLNESKSFHNFDVCKKVEAKGARSHSLNTERSKKCPFNCCRVIFDMNNKSRSSDFLSSERQSRWDNTRRLQLCQNSDNMQFDNQNDKEPNYSNEFGGNDSSIGTQSSKVDFKTLVTIFLKRSSIYALNQVGNSSTTRRKIFWALIMIIGILGSGIQIIQYLKAYFSYPVVVNMDSKYTLDQEFPAVTICNLNRVRKEFLPCLKRNIPHEECNPSVEDEDMQPVFTNDAYCEIFSNNISDNALTRYMWQNLYLSQDDASKKMYGHQGEDFIRSCSFNGEICSLDNFTQSIDIDYGNCYTFNAANDTTPPLKTPFVGPNGGLELEIDLEVHSYSPQTKATGARFQVHDPYHDPEVRQYGVNVSPGFETSVTLSKFMMLRLKKPYKDHCKDYPARESMNNCNQKCFYKMIFDRCQCGIADSEFRHCDFTKMSDICCIYGPLDGDLCDCPLSCNDTYYEINIFSAVYPSSAYYSVNAINSAVTGDVLSYDAVRETILKLKIYYDTLETIIYQQKPMYQSSELFSQIGGQMGLWLGLSLVAIFECIENVVLLWKYRSKNLSQIRPTR